MRNPNRTLDETINTALTSVILAFGIDNIGLVPKIKSEAHQAIATALEAIIGKDDFTPTKKGLLRQEETSEVWETIEKDTIRNKLKAEQRQRLALYLNLNSQETQ